eukprot:Amastigsp_a509598_547.p2 type:complete len:203 gc:universal Amastigsp_a509598_547:90-698(+)
MTFVTASRKSFWVTVLRRARIANMPASVHTERMSAPVELGQRRASSSKRMSRSQFMLFAWMVKMCVRPSRSGSPNSILRSRRPGRSRAGSRVSMRFVAMMTLTLTVGSKPSIWLSSSSRMRWTSRSAPVCESKRLVPIASISSMKMIEGAFSRARRNTSRTMRGPSPRYFCTNSEPTTRMNDALVWCATALASMVLPVPGGP